MRRVDDAVELNGDDSPDTRLHRSRHYNAVRPHAALGYKAPAPEVFVPALAAWRPGRQGFGRVRRGLPGPWRRTREGEHGQGKEPRAAVPDKGTQGGHLRPL